MKKKLDDQTAEFVDRINEDIEVAHEQGDDEGAAMLCSVGKVAASKISARPEKLVPRARK